MTKTDDAEEKKRGRKKKIAKKTRPKKERVL